MGPVLVPGGCRDWGIKEDSRKGLLLPLFLSDLEYYLTVEPVFANFRLVVLERKSTVKEQLV